MSIANLPKRAPETSPPTSIGGSAYNRLVDMLGDIARIVGPSAFGNAVARAGRGGHYVYGVIVANGPDGDADYSDARYWIKNADIAAPSTTANYLEYAKVVLTPRATADKGLKWFTATNLAEAFAGTHQLSVGDFVVCRQLPDDSFRWVFDRGVAGGLFVVSLSQVGGSNGNASVAPTYTYDVTSLAGASLGSAMTPSRPRTVGPVATASAGYGYYNSGGFVLAEVWETPETGGCS